VDRRRVREVGMASQTVELEFVIVASYPWDQKL
jgi:hypothetical protein